MSIRSETIVQISEIPALLPVKVSMSAVWRWINEGFHNVKIETFSVGRRRYSSVEATHRFLDSINEVTLTV